MIEASDVLSQVWREHFVAYERIYIGFSGGLDSTVLLHALTACPELRDKLVPIHVHHGLSPNADAWQLHCQTICNDWLLPLELIPITLNHTTNLEELARNARYAAFSKKVKANECLVTAHHQDDQAETLLLNLFRGAGVQGLSGIAEKTPFSEGLLVRPLLNMSRRVLFDYAVFHQLTWIDDESNENTHFSRNFIRHEVFPLLEKKWPGIRQNLARTSRLCHVGQTHLEALAVLDYPDLGLSAPPMCLIISQINQLTQTRLLNVLRYWFKRQKIRLPNEETLTRIVHEVIYARDDAIPLVQWDDVLIRRYQDRLYYLSAKKSESIIAMCDPAAVISWTDFPNSCALIGIGRLKAELVRAGIHIKKDDRVEVRFRQGGESFVWHGQTKSLKKLMQAWAIPQWERAQVPLIYVNNQLAMVVGYAISDLFYQSSHEHCYDITVC